MGGFWPDVVRKEAAWRIIESWKPVEVSVSGGRITLRLLFCLE